MMMIQQQQQRQNTPSVLNWTFYEKILIWDKDLLPIKLNVKFFSTEKRQLETIALLNRKHSNLSRIKHALYSAC